MIKKILKFFSLFLFIITFIFSLSYPIHALESESGYTLTSKAKAIYLYSYDADQVIFSQGDEYKLQPASTTKMMSGLLVCELFKDKLDKKITVTSDMLHGLEGNSMGLKSGMAVTLRDLLYGTVCGGNNDAATVLAYACTGDVPSFVKLMNQYSRAWDMTETNYANPIGMDNKNAVTTISDVAKLAKKASQNELYLKISSSSSYEISELNITIYNRNALISQFYIRGYLNKNSNGLIAGSTSNGGYVLATYATKNGNSVLCIVMDTEINTDTNEIYSYKIVNSLIEFVFNNYSYQKIADNGVSFGQISIENTLLDKSSTSVYGILNETLYAFVPNDLNVDELIFKPYFHENSIKAPIKNGETIGGVDIYYNDVFIAEARLVASQSVESNNLLAFIENMRSVLLGRVSLITTIIAIPAIAFYLLIRRMDNRRKRVSTIHFKRFY